MKTIIVHYHIFKNAGSTVDYILEQNFGGGWRAFDGPAAAGRIEPSELADYIRGNPDALAISSHQALLPPPQLSDVRIFPILFLRHPLDRVRSVYEFERRQGLELGPVSKGADHASRLPYPEYLRWRFDSSTNGVVHNHQTILLNFERRLQRQEISEQDFNKAVQQLDSLPVVGIVEKFDRSFELIVDALKKVGCHLESGYQVVNESNTRSASIDARLEKSRLALGSEMWDELLRRNQWDMKLYDYASKKFALMN